MVFGIKNQLEYWCNNKSDKMIQIIELYYNGFLE
jgi:hypothetical protein